MIGTPSEEDTQFITDKKYLEYIARFMIKPPSDLKARFPACTPESLELLSKMLVFNPYKRATVDELISTPYFVDV